MVYEETIRLRLHSGAQRSTSDLEEAGLSLKYIVETRTSTSTLHLHLQDYCPTKVRTMVQQILEMRHEVRPLPCSNESGLEDTQESKYVKEVARAQMSVRDLRTGKRVVSSTASTGCEKEGGRCPELVGVTRQMVSRNKRSSVNMRSKPSRHCAAEESRSVRCGVYEGGGRGCRGVSQR